MKRDRVMAALAGFVERGETSTIVDLAKRDAVSPRFIYNHPDLRADIERRAAEIGLQTGWKDGSQRQGRDGVAPGRSRQLQG